MLAKSRQSVAVALGGLIMLHAATAHSQAAVADQRIERGYQYLKERNANAALCEFTAAHDARPAAATLFAMAYCEYRLAHYTHARRLMALLRERQEASRGAGSGGASQQPEDVIGEKLYAAIVAFQQPDQPTSKPAPTPREIRSEIDSLNRKMLSVRFQLNQEELDYHRLGLAVDQMPLVPDLFAPPNRNVMLSALAHGPCEHEERARGGDSRRPVDRISAELARHGSLKGGGAGQRDTPAPGQYFELLLEPDRPHELTVLDEARGFMPLVHHIDPGRISAEEVQLSRKAQQAKMILDVTFEGWSKQSSGTAGKEAAPIRDVEVEVTDGKQRVFKGKQLLVSLAPGQYAVRVSPPGFGFKYESWQQDSVRLQPGQTPPLEVLLRKRPAYRNPWFWVGLIGGAATLGLAIGVPIYLSRDPHFERGTSQWLVRL